mgnify:CR=1 FL=1
MLHHDICRRRAHPPRVPSVRRAGRHLGARRLDSVERHLASKRPPAVARAPNRRVVPTEAVFVACPEHRFAIRQDPEPCTSEATVARDEHRRVLEGTGLGRDEPGVRSTKPRVLFLPGDPEPAGVAVGQLRARRKDQRAERPADIRALPQRGAVVVRCRYPDRAVVRCPDRDQAIAIVVDVDAVTPELERELMSVRGAAVVGGDDIGPPVRPVVEVENERDRETVLITDGDARAVDALGHQLIDLGAGAQVIGEPVVIHRRRERPGVEAGDVHEPVPDVEIEVPGPPRHHERLSETLGPALDDRRGAAPERDDQPVAVGGERDAVAVVAVWHQLGRVEDELGRHIGVGAGLEAERGSAGGNGRARGGANRVGYRHRDGAVRRKIDGEDGEAIAQRVDLGGDRCAIHLDADVRRRHRRRIERLGHDDDDGGVRRDVGSIARRARGPRHGRPSLARARAGERDRHARRPASGSARGTLARKRRVFTCGEAGQDEEPGRTRSQAAHGALQQARPRGRFRIPGSTSRNTSPLAAETS